MRHLSDKPADHVSVVDGPLTATDGAPDSSVQNFNATFVLCRQVRSARIGQTNRHVVVRIFTINYVSVFVQRSCSHGLWDEYFYTKLNSYLECLLWNLGTVTVLK